MCHAQGSALVSEYSTRGGTSGRKYKRLTGVQLIVVIDQIFP
jgi:hypothetical protein